MSPYDEDRLPGHDRRRRELVALLDADEPARRRRLVPAIAAGAVLSLVTIGVLAAQRWGDPEHLPSAGPVRGQDPSVGVAEDSAKVGDRVPWDIATRTLATCLDNGSRYAVTPPSPAGFGGPTPPPQGTSGTTPGSSSPSTWGPPPSGTGAPESKPSGTGAPESKPADFPSGAATTPGTTRPTNGEASFLPSAGASTPSSAERTGGSPDPQLWQLTEPTSAFKPYFTAWEPNGIGGLRPFVLGKAHGPGLAVCHGIPPVPDFPFPTRADGVLTGPLDLRSAPVRGPDNGPITSTTWWGRTTESVARIELTLRDGTVVPVVIRDGIWFANASSNTNLKPEPPRIAAFDSTNAELPDTTRVHWG
jgi:hypothetical protein